MTAKKTKVKEIPNTVKVVHGPLGGMVFTEIGRGPAISDDSILVKYEAPNNGPRAMVRHTKVRGEFRAQDKQEALRIAFSTLIPAAIQWSAENGYSTRKQGVIKSIPLAWDHEKSRFVPVVTESTPTKEGNDE